MKKNNKKSYLIGAVVIILILAAVAGFVYYKNDFKILNENSYWDSNKIESYKLGSVEFKIYPLDESGQDIKDGFFEVYNNGKKIFSSADSSWQISGLLAFKFKNNEYVVVGDYSGGAHCCDTDYLFRINSANGVKLIKTFSMGNASINKENLIFKNKNLYLALDDDRFAYFHVSYASSPFFNQYYKIEGDNLVLANNDFKEDYIKVAENCDSDINSTFDKMASSSKEDYFFEDWFSNLVCRTVNYKLAGEDTLAWQGFEDYFKKAGSYSSGYLIDLGGSKVTPAGIKQEIINQLEINKFFN